MDGYTDMLELMSSDREKDRSISCCSCKGPLANKIGVKKSGAGIEKQREFEWVKLAETPFMQLQDSKPMNEANEREREEEIKLFENNLPAKS